jgi:hypothetical protein
LIHVDVKKLGNIPDGGGWRFVGRSQGYQNRSVTAKRTGRRGIAGDLTTGSAFVHTVIDDRSRVARVFSDSFHTATSPADATVAIPPARRVRVRISWRWGNLSRRVA